MRDIEGLIMSIMVIILISLLTMKLGIQVNMQNEYIKQLEQSLNEQIQETEVYRGMLEEYQTEGIINE